MCWKGYSRGDEQTADLDALSKADRGSMQAEEAKEEARESIVTMARKIRGSEIRGEMGSEEVGEVDEGDGTRTRNK